MQLKFSAVMKAGGGLTIPAQGAGGSWIVKLPSAGRFRDEWPAAKREPPVAERVARAIDAHLVALPLAGGR